MIAEVSNTNQELLRKYKREMNLRKKCHNELVRLKGTNCTLLCLSLYHTDKKKATQLIHEVKLHALMF